MHNNAFWSNSNAFSLIICKVHTKRENSGSWKSGPGKATSGHLFCTTPNKLKLHGEFLWNIWWILEQISTGGGPRGEHNPPGRAREPRRALVSCAHQGGPLRYLFAPIFIIYLIKKISGSRFPTVGILPLCVYLAYYERKGIRITPKSIIMDKNIINNSKKTWCKMDVSMNYGTSKETCR